MVSFCADHTASVCSSASPSSTLISRISLAPNSSTKKPTSPARAAWSSACVSHCRASARPSSSFPLLISLQISSTDASSSRFICSISVRLSAIVIILFLHSLCFAFGIEKNNCHQQRRTTIKCAGQLLLLVQQNNGENNGIDRLQIHRQRSGIGRKMSQRMQRQGKRQQG